MPLRPSATPRRGCGGCRPTSWSMRVETPLPDAVHVRRLLGSRPGRSQDRQGAGGTGDADRKSPGQPDPAGGMWSINWGADAIAEQT